MKYLIMIAALVMLVAAVPAMAVKRTGNDLLIDCSNLIKTESMETVSKDNVLGMGYCIGLIDGMVTFNYVYESVLQREESSNMLQMCLPERISTRQSAQIIVKYLLGDTSGTEPFHITAESIVLNHIRVKYSVMCQ